MPDFDSITTLFWSAHKVPPPCCALWSEAIQVYVFVFFDIQVQNSHWSAKSYFGKSFHATKSVKCSEGIAEKTPKRPLNSHITLCRKTKTTLIVSTVIKKVRSKLNTLNWSSASVSTSIAHLTCLNVKVYDRISMNCLEGDNLFSLKGTCQHTD